MHRREFLRTGLTASAAVTWFGSSFWRALASHTEPTPGPSPYGPLGDPDANGFRLPQGFRVREIARAGFPVPGTGYPWHVYPDGGATFATGDGGWIYVSNSEIDAVGGASAIRWAADGTVVSAYRILGGTSRNCAGGSTPWGTWLSCEETESGMVWECDPLGLSPPLPRPSLGSFMHEAAVVDPATRRVYMTEDRRDGRFYRFTPDPASPLDALGGGVLEVAKVEAGGRVTWIRVPNPNPAPVVETPTRLQVPLSTAFLRGEGAWFDDGVVYFCTTSDNTIWTYDVSTETIERFFHGDAAPNSPLSGADNITRAPWGDLFVCEDGYDLQLIVVTRDGVVAPFLQATGFIHDGSELAGVAFDPAGTRMYLSSQRAFVRGVTYEVTGPFSAS